MKISVRLLITCVTALSALVLSGCSLLGSDQNDGSTSLAPMWKMEFEQILRMDSISEFERSVLEDYWVDDEEWQNAQDLFHECMNLHGLEGIVVTAGEGAGYGTSDADQAKMNAEGGDVMAKLEAGIEQAHECANGTVRQVGLLYAGPRANADGLEFLDLIRACLNAAGFEDHSLVTDETLFNGQSDPQFQTDPEFYRCITEPSV